MFFKIGALKTFANFTGKHLFRSLFFIELQAQACNFIQKKLQHRYFSVKFAIFFEHLILLNTSGGCFWQVPVYFSEKQLTPIAAKSKSRYFFLFIASQSEWFKNEPSRGVYIKRCSENNQQFYRKTTQITLQHGCLL